MTEKKFFDKAARGFNTFVERDSSPFELCTIQPNIKCDIDPLSHTVAKNYLKMENSVIRSAHVGGVDPKCAAKDTYEQVRIVLKYIFMV